MKTVTYSGNKVLQGKHGKPITFDARWLDDGQLKPVVLFVHGFKGFKDWGHFNLIADNIARQGCVLVKMNFSHNGTSPEHLEDFVDLEAFGNNNFTKELADISVMLDHLFSPEFEVPNKEMDQNNFTLTGHSRGGSTAILAGAEDKRITKLVTWAAVADIEKRYSSDELGQWKKEGVVYIHNGRTNQEMPLYYQLAEDFFSQPERFNIPKIIQTISKPMLILHGDNDTSVDVEDAYLLKKLQPEAELEIITGADHTFGGTHPWAQDTLPEETEELLKETVSFIKS